MIYSQIATVLKRSPKYNIPSRQQFKFVGLSLTNNIVFKSFSLFIRKRVFLMVYFEIVKNPRVIRSEKNGKGNLFKKTLTLFIIPLLRTKMPNIWEGTPPSPNKLYEMLLWNNIWHSSSWKTLPLFTNWPSHGWQTTNARAHDLSL